MAVQFNGTKYFIRNLGRLTATAKDLNVLSDSSYPTDGTSVTLAATSNAVMQRWFLTLYSGVGCKIFTEAGSTRGLNIVSTSNPNCTIWPSNGQNNNDDSMIDLITVNASLNRYRIKMISKNLYLTVTGGAALNYPNVEWKALNSSDDQVWDFLETSGDGVNTGTPNVASTHYTTKNPFYISSSGLKGQCTWYAAGRVSELTGKMPQFSQTNNRNAINWPSLITNGTVSTSPAPYGGCVAIWGNGIYGHVGVVESTSMGTCVFSECNGSNSNDGIWNEGVDGKLQYYSIADLKAKYSNFITFINF